MYSKKKVRRRASSAKDTNKVRTQTLTRIYHTLIHAYAQIVSRNRRRRRCCCCCCRCLRQVHTWLRAHERAQNARSLNTRSQRHHVICMAAVAVAVVHITQGIRHSHHTHIIHTVVHKHSMVC